MQCGLIPFRFFGAEYIVDIKLRRIHRHCVKAWSQKGLLLYSSQFNEIVEVPRKSMSMGRLQHWRQHGRIVNVFVWQVWDLCMDLFVLVFHTSLSPDTILGTI